MPTVSTAGDEELWSVKMVRMKSGLSRAFAGLRSTTIKLN